MNDELRFWQDGHLDEVNAKLEARKDISLQLFALKRYPWDIQCEQFSQTSSNSFFRTLKKISFYFYPNEQILDFPSLISGHSHSNEED